MTFDRNVIWSFVLKIIMNISTAKHSNYWWVSVCTKMFIPIVYLFEKSNDVWSKSCSMTTILSMTLYTCVCFNCTCICITVARLLRTNNTILIRNRYSRLPHCKIRVPSGANLMIRVLQYPSATKKSPVDNTATALGLQKCVSSLRGTNLKRNFYIAIRVYSI